MHLGVATQVHVGQGRCISSAADSCTLRVCGTPCAALANMERSSGILLHVTSLPGPHGIGDLGPAAYAWIDQLEWARQTWWQMLPLGPTGYADSPYQCFSAFAGNPTLISLERLIEQELLKQADLPVASFSVDKVDYDRTHLLK